MDNDQRTQLYAEKFYKMFSHKELAFLIAWTMVEGKLSDQQMDELLTDWIQIQTLAMKKDKNIN